MSFLEVKAGPWRGVAFLVGMDAPGQTPAGNATVLWRHDGTARLNGDLERAQAQLLIDETAVPSKAQRARPEPFTLRDVTTSVAGEGFVFAGNLFGQTGKIAEDDCVLLAQLTLAPGTEIAVAVDEELEHALISPDADLYLNRTPVPERSVGILGAGRRHLGIENRGRGIAHALLIGGCP